MSHDWKPTSLGEILTLERRPVKLDPDKEYAEIGIYSYGRGIFHKQPRTGFEVGDKDLFLIKKGDFIFQITFAWEGAFGLASEFEDGMYGSVRFPTFRVNEEICYPPFLINYFKIDDGRNQLVKISPGSAGRNRVLNTKRLPEIFVPLPPLNEQLRIMEHIEILSARISEVQSLREDAQYEANGLVNASLKYLLNAKENWTTKTIGEVSTMSTGTTPPSHQLDYYGGNILWYTPGDLGSHKELGKSTRTLSELAVQDRKARMFQSGTVLLVAIGGSIGKVGLTRVVCSSNQQITGILFNSEIFPDYGFWWMRRLYDEIRAVAPQATLPIINQQGIGRLNISYPSLDEQKHIVAYLDDLQERQAKLFKLQENTQKELDALLPSILDRAFKGEL